MICVYVIKYDRDNMGYIDFCGNLCWVWTMDTFKRFWGVVESGGGSFVVYFEVLCKIDFKCIA